jgi:hypothetical protein
VALFCPDPPFQYYHSVCVPPRTIRVGSARATRHYTVSHIHCLIACNKPSALSSPSVIYDG